MQLKEKKRRGPAMSSTAKITKGDASEDALPTESALLTNAGGGDKDEQGEALFIPEKTEVGEKMINETGVAVKRAFSAARQKMAYVLEHSRTGTYGKYPYRDYPPKTE